MRKPQSGFTLIEIMIVIAIIGILAAIAIPAYQNYTVRAQVSEGLTLSSGWKTAIVEYYNNTGSWPSQADLTGTAPSVGTYVQNLTVTNGGIVITYGGTQANQQLNGAILNLVPYTTNEGDILCQCGSAAPPGGTMAPGANPGTTLAAQFLPTSCHS